MLAAQEAKVQTDRLIRKAWHISYHIGPTIVTLSLRSARNEILTWIRYIMSATHPVYLILALIWKSVVCTWATARILFFLGIITTLNSIP